MKCFFNWNNEKHVKSKLFFCNRNIYLHGEGFLWIFHYGFEFIYIYLNNVLLYKTLNLINLINWK